MSEMPRDPVKLAQWLQENRSRLPAEEAAMLDKALAGGKQIYAQGPPIVVDMGEGSSKGPAPAGRAPDGGPAMSDMPRDPVKLAQWLQENRSKLPADEAAMLDKAIAGGKQIYAQGPPIAVDMGDQEAAKPGFFARVGSKISDLASTAKDKITSLFSRKGSDTPAVESPGDAQWKSNPIAKEPGEEKGDIGVDRKPAAPGLDGPGWQNNPLAESKDAPAPDHPAHHLMTNAEAHEYAKEVVQEHELERGHQRGGPSLGM